jgi:hypothetical protein
MGGGGMTLTDTSLQFSPIRFACFFSELRIYDPFQKYEHLAWPIRLQSNPWQGHY